MSLTAILNATLDHLDEARFAGVVGTDGLGIEMVFADEGSAYDLELAEIELATLAATASAAAARIGAGLVHTITVESEALSMLAALVAPGYFAVLGLPGGDDLSAARAALQAMVERIRAEL